MRFVAIEFDNKVNNTHTLGYLRIPEQFNPQWHLGFREYLKDKYKIEGIINIYPLNVSRTRPETMGKDIPGYTNMEDDFILAIRSNKYYPISEETSNIRRQWSMLDPMTQSFTVKER